MKIKAALLNRQLWPWMLITAGAVLRCWDLTSSPIWYDEAFSQMLAGLPLDRMITATSGDVHPPLYYFILQVLVSIAGNSVLVLRGFSVACSILGLVAVWYLAGLLDLSYSARLIALAVMTFLPVEIYYAQEARMYAWLQLLVLCQLIALIKRDWLRLGSITFMVLYSHNYGLFYTAIIGLIGLLQELKRVRPIYRPGIDDELQGTGIIPVIASVGIPGLLWLPWLAVLAGQIHAIEGTYWIEPLTAGSVVRAIFEILAGFNVPDPIKPVTMFAVAAALALLVIGGIRGKKFDLLLLACGPLALAVIGSLVMRPILLFRGLLPSVPALCLLAGYLVSRADWRGRVVTVALIAPLIVTLGWQIGANNMHLVKGVPIMQMVDQPIIHMDDTSLVLNESPDTDRLLNAGCPEERGALTESTRRAMGFQSVRLSELPDKFYYAAMLTPLATRCHEETFHQLSDNATPVFTKAGELGIWGVWYVTLR